MLIMITDAVYETFALLRAFQASCYSHADACVASFYLWSHPSQGFRREGLLEMPSQASCGCGSVHCCNSVHLCCLHMVQLDASCGLADWKYGCGRCNTLLRATSGVHQTTVHYVKLVYERPAALHISVHCSPTAPNQH